ncbi:hypothetical protein MLD38_016532 [Melastoma candidum]|uniref:Uncharacterized protein n=1 Tax=Melastoma candidum TaxID=119954 RepID=A0ACB9QLX7_9MYRT|nr:hypothetical protein MLD38_016532 [Melastoma candidum]
MMLQLDDKKSGRGPAFLLVGTLCLLVARTLGAPNVGTNSEIPADSNGVGAWFTKNVKPYMARKGTIDPNLEFAEAGAMIIKVRKQGKGDFNTITAAVNSIPAGNNKRVIIWIGGGVYKEKVKIDRTKPFVTFYAAPNSGAKLTFAGTAKTYGTVDSATLIVESDYFMAVNLIVENSTPQPIGRAPSVQALAIRLSGDKAAMYNCRLLGFQDTVCDDRGFHFFKDCYIEGAVDFIFGSGTSLYLNTELHVIPDNGVTFITAQARESNKEDTGYSLVHCSITGITQGTYLGRAWQTSPRVIFAYTNMGNLINPLGWSDNFHPERDRSVNFGEYKCSGPGSNPAGRAKFSKQLSYAEAKPFLSLSYIVGSKWLLPPPKL